MTDHRWRGWVRFVAIGVAAAALVTSPASASPSHAVYRSRQTLPLAFNQGIARYQDGWILSGTNGVTGPFGGDVLARADDQLNVLLLSAPAIPPQLRAQGYNHIGDIDVVGNIIYAPLEQPDYPLGHQVTARYDATTLLFIDSVELLQHENSFVSVDPDTMIAYSMDAFDGSTILRYDVNNQWQRLPDINLPYELHHTQGASVARGSLWIATSDAMNNLYRVDLSTSEVDLLGTMHDTGGEGEGIDATQIPEGSAASGSLHALNNALGNAKTLGRVVAGPYVYLEHFDVTSN